MKDINKMNGYEFESFVAMLLRKIGFIVEETSLSGDSGVDLIVYSEEPLYKGTYLVQCKRWDGNIGEPAVRDLYGVVLSKNANKGIIITNSFFTAQAIKFAEGKNIELINGDILNGLKNKYLGIKNTEHITHFLSFNDFENDKYQYLKNNVDENQRNQDAYLELFNFLYSYILNNNFEIMFSGLIEECLRLIDEIIKKFGKKGKKGLSVKNVFLQMKGTLLMLLGYIDKSFEILKQEKKVTFNKKNFTKNLVNHYFYFYPEHYHNRGLGFRSKIIKNVTEVTCSAYIIYKVNLLNLLLQIDDKYSSQWLYNKFIDYYDHIVIVSNDDEDMLLRRSGGLEDISNRNYKIAKEKIESTMNKRNELKIFIPTTFCIFDSSPYSSGLKYKTNKYFKIEDILPYWSSSDLKLEKQMKKLKLLISLIDNEID